MSDIVFDDPAVVFALRRESAPFLREFPPHQSIRAPCRARFCGPEWLSVLVLEVGVGAEATERAMSWLLSEPKIEGVACRPKLVLSAGFAGSLQDEFRVGDVVVATDVMDEDGTSIPATWPGELPPGEWQPPLRRGRVLTAKRLVGEVGEKRRLGATHSAAVVDMEAAVVAHWCRRHGVPFGAVKVVSDDLRTPLSPRLVDLLAGGGVSLPRLLAGIVKSPALLGEMWRLGRQTSVAAEQLGKALGELLTLTLDWAER